MSKAYNRNKSNTFIQLLYVRQKTSNQSQNEP